MHNIVKEVFQRDPSRGVNPDEVVAMGAAIQVRPVGPGGMRAPRGRGAQHLHLSMSPCKQPGCLCAQSTLLLICSLLGDLSPRPPTPGRRAAR